LSRGCMVMVRGWVLAEGMVSVLQVRH
jgi:hypothetical protein